MEALADAYGRGAKGRFPPAVAIDVVRLACECSDPFGRDLSPWDCGELMRQLIVDGLGANISAATIRCIMAAQQPKPRRPHLWLSPRHPHDAACYAIVADVIELYRRPLRDDEMVLSPDEKTSLQPRPRLAPTRPAQPQHLPNRYEHAYKWAGAINLFAAFDTRSDWVYGRCYERKRRQECIGVLEYLDQEIAEHMRAIHLV